MARRLTTGDLIKETRSILDEDNQVSIRDKEDIIPSLCRAQDRACTILAEHYEPPLMKHIKYVTPIGIEEYPIPTDAFEQRLLKVEVQIQNSLMNPVKCINYRDATLLETPARTSFPMFYAIIGTKFRLYPRTTNAYPLRLWYIKDPLPLVLEQGTITAINSAANYVIVDSIGSDLTVEADSVESYVNFIDGSTGEVKGTCQIQSFDTRQITFRAVPTPTRKTVLGLPVSGNLPADLEPDDLICTAGGTCISVLKKPLANYLISMAVSELLNTKLGMTSEMGEKVRLEMETAVKESWAGRESYIRVKAASPHWQKLGRGGSRRY
jgi:hypothetical protein